MYDIDEDRDEYEIIDNNIPDIHSISSSEIINNIYNFATEAIKIPELEEISKNILSLIKDKKLEDNQVIIKGIILIAFYNIPFMWWILETFGEIARLTIRWMYIQGYLTPSNIMTTYAIYIKWSLINTIYNIGMSLPVPNVSVNRTGIVESRPNPEFAQIDIKSNKSVEDVMAMQLQGL